MLLRDNTASNQEIKASIYYFSRQKSPFFTWKTHKIAKKIGFSKENLGAHWEEKFLKKIFAKTHLIPSFSSIFVKNSKNKHKNHEKPQNIGQKSTLFIENSPQNLFFHWKTPFFSKKYDGSYRNFQNTGSKSLFYMKNTQNHCISRRIFLKNAYNLRTTTP